MRYFFDDFELDDELFELRRRGEPVHLRPQALDVLLMLLRLRERVVTKRELVDAVWSGAAISETALPQAIAAVRRALDDAGDQEKCVQTVRGRGYRFVAEVRDETAAPASMTIPPSSRSLIPRSAELSALEEMLGRAGNGHGGVAMLTGDAGAGRTRTVLELAARARALGWIAVVARCDEEASVPELWPWKHLVRELLQDEAVRAAAVDQPFWGALSAMVPGADQAPAADLDGRFGLFDAVAQLLRRTARGRPILMLIDDLHAADVPSLLLVKHLSREIREARVLLVVTYREGAVAASSQMVRVLGALSREDPNRRILLRPLEAADIRHLAATTLGHSIDDATVDWLRTKTGGNMLLLAQSLHAMRGSAGVVAGSTSALLSVDEMKEAIGLHLNELPPECRRALDAAAVLGVVFPVAPLGSMLEMDDARVLECLDEAARARVVVRDGAAGRFRFLHPLVRDVLYRKLGGARQHALHERAAAALAATSAGDEADAHRARARALLGGG